jgi:hypothetical protein
VKYLKTISQFLRKLQRICMVRKGENISPCITIKLLDGNARKAESVSGWGRATVKKGMRELATGIKCMDNYSLRGNKKTEEKIPQLAVDIRAIVDPKSQADPHFQTTFAYTRITAKAVRQALINEKEYTDDELPCENTIGVILNRLDYRLKRIQKTKPLKNSGNR